MVDLLEFGNAQAGVAICGVTAEVRTSSMNVSVVPSCLAVELRLLM